MTGRHEAPRQTRGSNGLDVSGLVRRGARTGRATALLFAIITAAATAYLVVTPRVQTTAYDAALGDELRSAGLLERGIMLSVQPQNYGLVFTNNLPTGQGPGTGITPPFAEVDTAALAALGEDRDLVTAPVLAAQTEPFAMTRESGGGTGDPPQAVLRVQGDLDGHVRWIAGRAPGKPADTRVISVTGFVIQGDGTTVERKLQRRVHVMPVGLSQDVADGVGVEVGDLLRLAPAGDAARSGDPVFVEVAGVFEPRDAENAFWQAEPRMLGLAAVASAQGGTVRQGAFVLPLESYAPLSDSLVGGSIDDLAPLGSPLMNHTLSYEVRSDIGRADADRLKNATTQLGTAPDLTRLPERPRVTTGLPILVERYQRALTSTSVVTSFAAAGMTALAVIVLTLTALVAAAGRMREFTLVTARGAARWQVLLMALTGPLVWGAAAAVVTSVLGILLIDGTTPWASWLQVALVVVLPAAVVAVQVLAQLRERTTGHSAATDLVRTARRIVAEVALVLLAVLAVNTIRARGDVIADGRTDWYAALTPVLVAAAGAVVVFRLLPLPIRALSRLAGRGRGYVGFLGLARSSRASTTAGLPLLALVVGSSVLTVLASVFVTIGQQREVSVMRTVGADARVDAVRLDADVAEALAKRPGVSAVAPAYVERGAQIAGDIVSTGRQATSLTVIGVDPTAYGKVVSGTPLESAATPTEVAAGRVPVQLSADAEVGDEIELVVRETRVPATVTVVDPALGRIESGKLVTTALVPLDALQKVVPAAQPTTAFVAATPGASEELARIGKTRPTELGDLVTGAESAEALSESTAARALPRFVTRTYAVTAALGAVLTFLAVVLLLVAGRPERRALLLRLRTMGMPRRAEGRLLAVEVLPLLVTAVLVGCAIGVAAPLIVAKAVDLAAYTSGPRQALTPQWWVGAAAGLAALLLAVLALVLEEFRTRRASAAAHLRGGDNS